jgi:hypothetical protein
MPTSAPRTPAWHYAESERALAAAESSIEPSIQTVAALICIGHALLCAAPRRARSSRERSSHQPGGESMSPQQRWLYGDDNEGDQR